MEKGLFSRKKLYSIPFSLPSKIIWDFDLPHARICWLRCTGCITNLGTAWWIHSALMYKVTKNDKKKREKRNAKKPEHTKWAHSVLNCLQVIFISADKDNTAPIYCYCSRTRELSSFYGIPLQVYNVQYKLKCTTLCASQSATSSIRQLRIAPSIFPGRFQVLRPAPPRHCHVSQKIKENSVRNYFQLVTWKRNDKTFEVCLFGV